MEENTDFVLEDFKEFYKELDLNLIRDLTKGIDIESEASRNKELLCYMSNNRDENPEDSKVIRDFSVAIVHYIFRNGPIESMHSGTQSIQRFSEIPADTPFKEISQLSEEDMKKLNIYMVDRVGWLLTMFQQADYTKIRRVLKYSMLSGVNWDSPKFEELEEEYDEYVLRSYQKYKDKMEK